MNQAKLAALLGRPLTQTEVDNLDLYLQIAKERLGDLICSDLCDQDNRFYTIREGYETVFTDIFTDITSVKLDGEVFTDYEVYQNDRRNGQWFNSIVLNKCYSGEVEIEADWGFGGMPVDVQLLLAKLFGLVGSMNTSNGNIKSKKVEDFSITFGDTDVYDQFVTENHATIDKYSQCNVGYIRHGVLCHHGYDCIRCIPSY